MRSKSCRVCLVELCALLKSFFTAMLMHLFFLTQKNEYVTELNYTCIRRFSYAHLLSVHFIQKSVPECRRAEDLSSHRKSFTVKSDFLMRDIHPAAWTRRTI